MENGCARAHVQMQPTLTCVKLEKRVSSTPSPRHVPRAVAGTGGYRHRGQIRNLLNGDIEQRRPLVNRSTRSRDISFSKASWGRVGSGRVGSGRAAHTEISPLNYRRTRSALRAPLVITVHSFYQAMAARYQIQIKEENFASWSFLCIIMLSMYFALKQK